MTPRYAINGFRCEGKQMLRINVWTAKGHSSQTVLNAADAMAFYHACVAKASA